jgi:hypothetical protein
VSDFKKIRNLLYYAGFKFQITGDMSGIRLVQDNTEVEFLFAAGGDALTAIIPSVDDDGAKLQAEYDEGYDAGYNQGQVDFE